MPAAAHPGRLFKRELSARRLSANRLALDIGVPSGRITDILHGRRSISADTAVRLGRYFGNRAQFWLDLQSQYDIAVIERERGAQDCAPRPPGGCGVKMEPVRWAERSEAHADCVAEAKTWARRFAP